MTHQWREGDTKPTTHCLFYFFTEYDLAQSPVSMQLATENRVIAVLRVSMPQEKGNKDNKKNNNKQFTYLLILIIGLHKS